MTYEQLSLPICQSASVTASAFRARLSVLLELEEASKIHEELYFLRSCGWLKSDTLQFFSEKMLRDYLTTRGGLTFSVILSTMAELGYSVEYQVLDSQNFGVPQHRERVFIVGHFGGFRGRPVFPIGADDPPADGVQRQLVSNTLAAGDRKSIGIYIADRQTDRQTDRQICPQGKRLPQGIVLNAYKPPKETDVACTLDTKCGSIPGFNATYVKTK